MIEPCSDSRWALTADLLSARLLVWIASVGRNASLTRDTHLYFFDRYSRLARCHRASGRARAAVRFQARADVHYRAAGGDGPPFAAAMAMPRPSRWVRTDAIGRDPGGPPDAA